MSSAAATAEAIATAPAATAAPTPHAQPHGHGQPAADAPVRTHIRAMDGHRWEDLPVLHYKEDGGTHFRSITRQLLCPGQGLGCELRYFEIEPGGHSTLEIHQHIHSVIILRGKGQCLVGDQIYTLAEHDIIYIPTGTWHQFRANLDDHLGFLCMVNHDRDRPTRPSEAAAARLRENPEVAAFIRM
ncbi:MAG: cupin domain-containing protein [Candidatus Methylacidiphilales bacterium]|nr:cupin domain-containing protein [Candidatus Methylacidiphilales bacterium]